MADFFHEGNRALQAQFDTTRLADRVGELTHDRIGAHDKAFIERMDMFFLATVDEQGHANCSYKGGEPGFVGVWMSVGGVSELRRERDVPVDGERVADEAGGDAVHRLRGSFPDASERRGDDRCEGSVDGGVSGGAVHCAGDGAGDLSELPAIHPQDAVGGTVSVCTEVGVRDTGAGVEDIGMG